MNKIYESILNMMTKSFTNSAGVILAALVGTSFLAATPVVANNAEQQEQLIIWPSSLTILEFELIWK